MFKRHYLKIRQHILEVLLNFCKCTLNLLHFEEKDHLHLLNISEVIDSEKYGYLNARSSRFRTTLESQGIHG